MHQTTHIKPDGKLVTVKAEHGTMLDEIKVTATEINVTITVDEKARRASDRERGCQSLAQFNCNVREGVGGMCGHCVMAYMAKPYKPGDQPVSFLLVSGKRKVDVMKELQDLETTNDDKISVDRLKACRVDC